MIVAPFKTLNSIECFKKKFKYLKKKFEKGQIFSPLSLSLSAVSFFFLSSAQHASLSTQPTSSPSSRPTKQNRPTPGSVAQSMPHHPVTLLSPSLARDAPGAPSPPARSHCLPTPAQASPGPLPIRPPCLRIPPSSPSSSKPVAAKFLTVGQTRTSPSLVLAPALQIPPHRAPPPILVASCHRSSPGQGDTPSQRPRPKRTSLATPFPSSRARMNIPQSTTMPPLSGCPTYPPQSTSELRVTPPASPQCAKSSRVLHTGFGCETRPLTSFPASPDRAPLLRPPLAAAIRPQSPLAIRSQVYVQD